jgi:GR25 family glycosyltransferase involved in LPS biosynthesis
MDIHLTPDVKTYYINLDKNQRRNENMKSIIKKYGLWNYERVPGILTKSVEHVNFYKDQITEKAYETLMENNKNRNRSRHSQLTNGSIGCFLSHMKIYKDIVEKDIPYAIIFEDDVGFEINKEKFWDCLSNIYFPKDTDIVLLNCITHEDKCIGNQKLKKIHFFFGMWFYLITNKGAKKALRNLLPINEQIDFKLSILSYYGKLNIYHYFWNDFNMKDNNLGTDIQLLGCDDCDIETEILEVKTGMIINTNKRQKRKKVLFAVAIMIFLLIVLISINFNVLKSII